MATKKTTQPEDLENEIIENEDPFEYVDVKIPKISGRDDPVYVSVNDYSCTIKRGVKVQVPRYVKWEIDRAEAAQDALDATVDKLLEQSK